MRPGHPFYCSLVLKAEVDSKSSWTGPPACLRHSCWSFSPPHLSPCTSRPSPMFLSKITSLGSNLFSKLWKGSLRNELTSKFNHRSRARVVGVTTQKSTHQKSQLQNFCCYPMQCWVTSVGAKPRCCISCYPTRQLHEHGMSFVKLCLFKIQTNKM